MAFPKQAFGDAVARRCRLTTSRHASSQSSKAFSSKLLGTLVFPSTPKRLKKAKLLSSTPAGFSEASTVPAKILHDRLKEGKPDSRQLASVPPSSKRRTLNTKDLTRVTTTVAPKPLGKDRKTLNPQYPTTPTTPPSPLGLG